MERTTSEFLADEAARLEAEAQLAPKSHENLDLLVERIYRHLTPHLSEKMIRRVFGDKRSDADDLSTIKKSDLFDKLRQQAFVKKPIGLLMARRIEGVVYISYADLNEKANDKWDFKKAKVIAANRISRMIESKACLNSPYLYTDENGKEWTYDDCQSAVLDQNLDAFINRCNLYFKDVNGKPYPIVLPFKTVKIVSETSDNLESHEVVEIPATSI